MKYTLEEIAKKTGKKKSDIMGVIEPLRITAKQGKYSEEDFENIKELLSAKKQHLIDHVRMIIERHPFCTEQELPRLTGRPTSYIRWLLPIISEEDWNLAETDNAEIFYINVANLRTLLARGEINDEEFWVAVHLFGLENELG